MIMATSNEHKHGHTNRLITESSPYLLQHAHNPVDWYPWCEEAFELAREQDKPIFLSVGYSACHWCHVMEHESFEREDVAEILNKYFVSVKVDREERPDIDDVYMTATSLITGRGGWPNSLWLTTDKRPFYAGSYFPREDTAGGIGFKSVLSRLAQVWENDRGQINTQADKVTKMMIEVSQATPIEAQGQLSDELIEAAAINISGEFDRLNGGFGAAPKFPPHQILMFFLNRCRKEENTNLLAIITKTLDSMANGGIYDHIGGGFHRYSTDSRWFLPHFEKMLSDNALLAKIYAQAYLITGNERYRRVAQEILDWVLLDMTDKNGGFYSALDADSEGEEGKFYLWRYEEIQELLGAERAKEFADTYGFEDGGNYREEATGEKTGVNIAYLKTGEDQTDRLNESRKILLQARNKRVRPHLDDKILVNCNALMISGLAYTGKHLNEPKYIDAAGKAADFILQNMQTGGRLSHSSRGGKTGIGAYLDDYAFLADGILELFAATGENRRLDEAKALVETLFKHYNDGRGAFFNTADDQEKLLVRTRDPYDKAIPSGNGAAAVVLVKLASITGDKTYLEQASQLLNCFLGFMEQAPAHTATLLTAADMI